MTGMFDREESTQQVLGAVMGYERCCKPSSRDTLAKASEMGKREAGAADEARWRSNEGYGGLRQTRGLQSQEARVGTKEKVVRSGLGASERTDWVQRWGWIARGLKLRNTVPESPVT